MKLSRILSDELSEVFWDTGSDGVAGPSSSALSELSRSEHRAVQNLYAKAFRRALRRVRSNGRRITS